MKTFEDICKVEPKLKALFGQIPSILDAHQNFWINWAKIKANMSTLVGWGAVNPDLTGSDVYDIAYQALLAEAERYDRSRRRKSAR